jgi:hypothetical protein
MIAPLVALALAATTLVHEGREYPLYPAVTASCPELPSPYTAPDGREYVVVRLHDASYGVVDVTLADHADQVRADAADFPSLARTGLHDPAELAATTTITGRSLAEIDRLAAPGALSSGGFRAEDEDVLSILLGDDALVRAMGLTHRELARPLFHVWNLMQTDLALDRWSMRHHQWRNMEAMKYHGAWVLLDAHDTKGGQQSPFADGLQGSFWIVIRRALEPEEEDFLHARYAGDGPDRWDPMHGTLTRLWIGEMEAFYIQWYGFYEGHTAWRADPLGIARIFGLRSVEQLEAAFPGELVNACTRHHTAAPR